MRTTLYIDDALLKKTKEIAIAEGQSFTSFTEEALREAIARRASQKKIQPDALKTFKGQGLLPGVDLNDSANLLDAMES